MEALANHLFADGIVLCTWNSWCYYYVPPRLLQIRFEEIFSPKPEIRNFPEICLLHL